MKVINNGGEEKAQYFKPENEVKHADISYSPGSAPYELKIRTYNTKKGCWEFTMGEVYRRGELIFKVMRNYHQFWHCWVLGHPDGHDYLLCGEDYQGVTVLQLDTGEVNSYMNRGHSQGFGFCWAGSVKPSRDKTLLAVVRCNSSCAHIGCVWAGPFEACIYDLSNPMVAPLPRLYRSTFDATYGEWSDDNTIPIITEREVRESDGKPFSELSDSEFDELMDQEDEEDIDLRVKQEIKFIWERGISSTP